RHTRSKRDWSSDVCSSDLVVDTFVGGCSKMMWLFIMFILFDPFINFIAEAGSFESLVAMLQPLFKSQSKVIFSFVSTLTGIFGVGGAATADNIVMDNMFKGLVTSLKISPSDRMSTRL